MPSAGRWPVRRTVRTHEYPDRRRRGAGSLARRSPTDVCPYNPTADTDPFTDLFIAEDVMDPPMLLATARCSVIYATPS
jgi:hypothetical protein